ncbi:LysM peptidoglycan-binding domain-containing protein [uncultured Jatrophihabitans sp.]|uniref:LysM peptidoglycan-binding domain-containing protein n=1 Tax=uncultured Jatrophihabitans sp. TaxID=1610747 RepID=UPI0035CC87C8
MSVALDLDSLLVAQPVPARRPSLRVVPCEPAVGDAPRALARPDRDASTLIAPSVSVLYAPSPSSIAAPLRLTRRGVMVLAALTAIAGALLVWLAALSAPHAAAAGSTSAGPATVTVHSGDTLWALASRIAPERDPRAEVADLRRLNHLTDPSVMPGQVLRVR